MMLNMIRVVIGRRRFLTLTNIAENGSKMKLFHSVSGLKLPEPQLNIDKLSDPKLTEYHAENIAKRKGVGNINTFHELYQEYQRESSDCNRKKVIEEARRIPNDTHPDVFHYKDPKILKVIGKIPEFSSSPLNFSSLTEKAGVFRMDALGPFAGHRSYVFKGDLAELEHALVRFTLDRLIQRGFRIVSVPDILQQQIIENCGMSTTGSVSQVYHLDVEKHKALDTNENLCLSGTAEMALAGYLMNRTFSEKELPLKLFSVSRCYRAEKSCGTPESGLFRVHQFTKVEMFGVCTESGSDDLLEEFRSFQEEHFSLLNLHLQVLDMPPNELGAPAYRKYDLEAWMPGRKLFGEVSSCSNCTDYQSRRLNIQYTTSEKPNIKRFVHTVNGTACAIPRIVIALCETHQNDGTVVIPKILRPFMGNKKYISKIDPCHRFGDKSKNQFKYWKAVDKKKIFQS